MSSWAQQRRQLEWRSRELRLRSATLRADLLARSGVLSPPLRMADQLVAGLHWLRAHPEWPVGGFALLVLLRPRRALRWAIRIGRGWRAWRRARRGLEAIAALRRSAV